MTISPDHKRRLDEEGYVLIPDFIPAELLARLSDRIEDLFAEEGDRAGNEFKQEAGCRRLANLVDKGEVFREVIGQSRLLAYIEHVLGPQFKLSSLNVRSVDPHNATAQPLHADMGALADEQGYWVCNSVWLLDDFTPRNGALRVIPGSHRWGKLPQDVLEHPAAPHPQEVLITGVAGSVIVMNAHLWHGGLPNRTGRPRTALHAFFCRRDKPQQQYQKQLLRPEVQSALAPSLRRLLALDDPLNDRLCSGPVTRSGFLK